MAVTLADDALIDLRTARAYLRRTDGSDEEGDFITLLINAYTRAVKGYCNRDFTKVDGVSHKYRYDGSGVLSLAPYELRNVTAVVLFSDLPASAWWTLPAQSSTVESSYRLEPRGGTRDGTYLWLALPEEGQFHQIVPEILPTRRVRAHEVTVTGDWGMAAIPGDVQIACLMAVADAFRNPEAFSTRSLGALSFTEVAEAGDAPGRSLPPDARAMLSPYRRLTL